MEVVVRTLADLSPNVWLAPCCERCFHMGDALVREAFPAVTEIEALRKRLRCSKCGSKDVLLYRGWDVGGFSAAYAEDFGRFTQLTQLARSLR